ncbi:class I SAM-dependent methyltransferase [Pseudoxanthomonas mexicana]|uniref:class I SAM-dependent methyltransferase n=1 Tax=Pseudoxanthomonas mexicana TaxID=128785 RepID=UPI0020A200D6|nr:class I SAM-dependent methyltransferase [Pseudoxanthomonas mexicana]MCP1583166.1 SAM-dependent methyltransferase [Pseudoxanthomonas mexicana]
MDASFPFVEQDRKHAWTSYWRSGLLHSCPTSFRGNYGGVIADFWRNVGAAIPGPARILDLGTGNGSIPKLLSEVVRAPDVVEIDAVDLADVAPGWRAADASKVRFHPGVLMERLPFPSACFDVVCSQFGIEYARAPDAWLEALRVLKSGARLECVLHHRESVFARVAASERDHLAWLLQSGGLMDAAVELAPWVARVRAGDAAVAAEPKANALRERFNAVQRDLESRMDRMPSPDVLSEVRTHLHTILARSPEPLVELAGYRPQLEQAQLRSAELVACALGEDEISELRSLLMAQRPDATVEVKKLRQSQGLLAWTMSLHDGGSSIA